MNYPNYYPMYQPIQQPQSTSSFVVVPSEDDIRRYPVAPGNNITFRIENQPIVVEKSLGLSQFDVPQYKRFKLIEEDMPVPEQKEYVTKTELEERFAAFKEELTKKPTRKKVEDE